MPAVPQATIAETWRRHRPPVFGDIKGRNVKPMPRAAQPVHWSIPPAAASGSRRTVPAIDWAAGPRWPRVASPRAIPTSVMGQPNQRRMRPLGTRRTTHWPMARQKTIQDGRIGVIAGAAGDKGARKAPNRRHAMTVKLHPDARAYSIAAGMRECDTGVVLRFMGFRVSWKLPGSGTIRAAWALGSLECLRIQDR
jgi:hypothetical protein